MKNRFLRTMILGVLAGIAISLGAAANIVAKSFADQTGILGPIIGAFLFPLGLITVCTFGFFLYTGKIGYLVDNFKKEYALDLLAGYLGNLIGAVCTGYLFFLIPGFADKAMPIASAVAGIDIVGTLVRGFFCGFFVFLAVDIYKRSKGGVYGMIGVLFLTAAFVLIGCWHCIANMFYFSSSNLFGADFLVCLVNLALVTLGNSLGSIALRGLIKLTEKKEETKSE